MLLKITFEVRERTTCKARQKARQQLSRWQLSYPITVFVQRIDVVKIDQNVRKVVFTAEVEGWAFEDARVTPI